MVLGWGEPGIGTHLDIDALRQAAGFKHGQDMAEYAFIHEECVGSDFHLLLAAQAVQHVDRFGSRCGVVQQGGIGQRKAGQVADHALEQKQGFEASL